MALVWIGHVPGDAVKARRIGVALERAGHKPWFDDAQARAGEPPIATMERGLAKADAAVLCLSWAAVEGGWIELARSALSQSPVQKVGVARLEFVSPAPNALSGWPAFELRWDDATWNAGALALVDLLAEGAAERKRVRQQEMDAALAQCEQEPAALALLRVIARFAPGEVPRGWVLGAAEPELAAEAAAAAMAVLEKRGLVRVGPEQIALEPAVWERVRAQTPADAALVMTGWAMDAVLSSATPEEEGRLFHAQLEQLVADGRAITDRRLWATFASVVGEQLINCSELRAGRALLEQALPIIEEFLPVSEELATSIFNLLARIYVKESDDDTLRQLVDGAIVRHTPDRPPAPEFDFEVAKACFIVGKLRFAERLLLPALTNIEQQARPPKLIYLDIFLLSSRIAVQLGDYHRAQELAEQALPYIEAVKGRDSEEAASQLDVLGRALHGQQNWTGAIAIYQRVLGIYEQIRSPSDPRKLAPLTALAQAAHKTGDMAMFEGCVERARAIAETLRETAPTQATAILLTRFAQMLQKTGRTEHARAALDQAHAAAKISAASTLVDPHVDRLLSVVGHSLEDSTETLMAASPGAAASAVTAAIARLQDGAAAPADQLAASENAESVALQTEDWANAARAAYLIGDVHGRKGGWEAARRAIARGLQYARRTNEVRLMAEGYRLHGDACLQGSDYEAARLDYEEAIRAFGALGQPQRSHRVRLVLLALLVQLNRAGAAAPHIAAIEMAITSGTLATEDHAQAKELLALVHQVNLSPSAPPDTQAAP